MLLDEEDNPLEDVVVIGHEAVSDYNASNILPQPDAVVSEIRSWLKPTQYADDGSEFQKHSTSHLKGTGQWALNSPIFREWHSSQENGTLWIRGIPGVGKSVLAAKLITHLTAEACPVLYFFFRGTIESNHRPEAALRDWLCQLLEFSPPLQLALSEATSSPVNDLASTELYRYLKLAMNEIPKVYCVVDALDEMDNTTLEPFIQLLDQLGNMRPDGVKLIITSRPIVIIERIVRNLKLLDIRLDKELVEPDLSFYVDHRLGQSRAPSESHSAIADGVLKKAEGLFLYAKLAMDAISHMENETEIFEALDQLPANLSIMYSRLLGEHLRRTGISKDFQILVLQLVTHAVRPLRLLEISDCIRVTQPQYGDDAGIVKGLVRSACGPLLEVLPDETVRVVHHSLTEYLTGITRAAEDEEHFPVFKPAATHGRVALLCISYLQLGSLESVRIELDDITREDLLQLGQIYTPFTKYAAKGWWLHSKRATEAGHDTREINKALNELLIPGGKQYAEKLSLLGNLGIAHSTTEFTNSNTLLPQSKALLLAISTDLTSFAECILSSHGKELVKYNGNRDEQPPLHLAVMRGNCDMVRLFLRYGADVNQHDSHGLTPLHAVFGPGYGRTKGTTERHRAVARILLDAGANPWKLIGNNQHILELSLELPSTPPIEFAFDGSDEKMAKVFLPFVKDTRAVSMILTWALYSQNLNVVGIILKHPHIDINAKDRFHSPGFAMTPFYVACTMRDPKLIAMLLEAGADPNVLHNRGFESAISEEALGRGFNALHALASPGTNCNLYRNRDKSNNEETRECFKLVIDAGVNIHQVNHDKTTPLHLAQDVISASCLLEAGADANAVNRWGETPLHICDKLEIMEVLFGKVDINAQCVHGETLLLKVLKNGGSEKALKLLDVGADATLADKRGNNAFHYAVERKNIGSSHGRRLLERLMEQGADPNLCNSDGHVPLQLIGSNDTFLSMFLEITKADAEVKDEFGQLTIFRTLESFNLDKEEVLTAYCARMAEAGARFDTMDMRGRTLLHALAPNCRIDGGPLRLLVDKGVDPKQTDIEGNTIWHEAVPRFSTWRVSQQVFKDITALGVDVTMANKHGRKPLHILCQFNQFAVYVFHREKNDYPSLFEYVLAAKPEDVNCCDNNGVSPLHIVATFSEHLTRRLLVAGADVRAVTNEGLTVFHLASRSRQANIVGLLIDWMRSNGAGQDVTRILDSKDSQGRSALYYACASGRVETVQLLLEAGATVDTHTYIGSAWNGCANFEDEDKHWTRKSNGGNRCEPHSGSVLISDSLRPAKRTQTITYRIERIDEILELLIAHGENSGEKFIDEAIASAADRKRDYTVERLWHARNALGVTTTLECEEEARACITRRDTIPKLDLQLYFDYTLRHLMSERHYKLVPGLILEYFAGATQITAREIENLVQGLVCGGFLWILDSILTPEFLSILKIASLKAVNQNQDDSKWLGNELAMFLYMACRVEQPNMSIIRLLVNKGANLEACINTMSRTGEMPLNALVRGEPLVEGDGQHWWQISQALPYLIEQGTNVEQRNRFGETALNASLEKTSHASWNSTATEILLKAGADPNTIDCRGHTPLGRAIKNREVFELLLSHGAIVTDAALSSAIESVDVDALELMLSLAEKSKKVHKQEPEILPPKKDPEDHFELYPIDLVLCDIGRKGTDEVAGGMRMLKLLLEHGADLNARYESTTVMHRNLQRIGPRGNTTYGCHSAYMPFVLKHPSLEVDARDGSGSTLFLLACRLGDISTAEILLHRGADIHARDNDGKNALHLLIFCREFMMPKSAYEQTTDISLERGFMNRIIKLSPDLLHQVDSQGRTPLHIAVNDKYKRLGLGIEELVAAGANVNAANAKTGDSPLHLLFGGMWQINVTSEDDSVVSGRRLEIFELFRSVGGDVNARNQAGETPAFCFFREGTVKTQRLSPKIAATFQRLNNWAPQEVGRKIAIDRQCLVLDMFERAGVDWHVVSDKGQSMLHVVAGDPTTEDYDDYGTRPGRFRFLMGKGIDVLAEDVERQTALDIAAAVGAQDVLDLFKKA